MEHPPPSVSLQKLGSLCFDFYSLGFIWCRIHAVAGGDSGEAAGVHICDAVASCGVLVLCDYYESG